MVYARYMGGTWESMGSIWGHVGGTWEAYSRQFKTCKNLEGCVGVHMGIYGKPRGAIWEAYGEYMGGIWGGIRGAKGGKKGTQMGVPGGVTFGHRAMNTGPSM